MRTRTNPVPNPQPRHPAASHSPRMTPGAIAGAAIAGALIALAFGATSAAAQVYAPVYAPDGTYVDEVVVTPSYSRSYRGGVERLSRPVSIRDLDLTTYSGRDELNRRIRVTAHNICRELGEDRFTGSNLTSSSSCEAQAIRDVRPQVRLAVNQAFARPAYAALDTPYPYDFRVYP